jgi:hypothetical protein
MSAVRPHPDGSSSRQDPDFPSARETLALVRRSLARLTKRVEREKYAGYDPYDALLSPLAARAWFRRPAARIAFTQILRRLPVNVRPALRIPKGRNPKGLALFLSGYAARAAAGDPAASAERIRSLVRMLDETRTPGRPHACWGYNFPWQNRHQLYPVWTPTLVNTGFAGHALLDAYAATGDREPLEMAEGAARFILEDLRRVVDDGSRLCLGYTPLDSARIVNSNAIGASFLGRIGALRGRPDRIDAARRMLNWVSDRQNRDGSWAYGESATQGWIDLHHTAFILESLARYESSTSDRTYRDVLKRGEDRFLRLFFDADGSASLWHDRRFPKDVHAFAAVSALAAVPQTDPVRRARRRLVRWLITRMQSPDGDFDYQIHRHYAIRIPYMRWSQAWAFYGLSLSLLADSRVGGAS